MSRTTAKKGMLEYKKGFGKNDFEYDFLNKVNYDDKRVMKEVIETLFGKIKGLEETLENIIVDRDKFREQYSELKQEHDRMLLDVKVLSTFTLD